MEKRKIKKRRVVADMASPCTCKVCSKKFPYDGFYSPMLTEERWNEVVSKCGLSEYEQGALELRGTLRSGTNVFNFPDSCLFICLDCMENALGRKLTRKDINDSYFNKDFIEKVLNESF